MDENTKIKELMSSLEAQKRITRINTDKNLIEYSFRNIHERTLQGKIALSSGFDVLYMSFNNLTNKHYARGESLEVKDVEKFIQSSINEKITYGKKFFGKRFMSIGNLVLDEKFEDN